MKRDHYLFFSVLFVFILLPNQIFSQKDTTKPINSLVDKTYSQYLQTTLDILKNAYGVTGVSMAVNLPKQGTWLGTSGYADYSTKSPILPSMLFGFGSNTKTMITALFLQLVTEGKVSLKDTIGKWIIGYKNIKGTITIRQLLDHTSGLYNYTNDNVFNIAYAEPSRVFSGEELMREHVLAPLFNPDEQYSYTNTGFILLGMIAEKILKTNISDELRNRFFIPLGLKHTFLGDSIVFRDSLFVGHNATYIFPSVYPDYFGNDTISYFKNTKDYLSTFSLAWTAGAIISTAEDMMKWAKGFYGGNLISKDMYNEMIKFTPQSDYTYGLGCMKIGIYSRLAYGHGGQLLYTSLIGHFVDDSVSFAFVNNDGRPSINFLHFVGDFLVKLFDKMTDVKTFDSINELQLSNFPNPAKDFTSFNLYLKEPNNIYLCVYDLNGNLVKTIVNEQKEAGTYTFQFNTTELNSGVYFYRLKTGNHSIFRSFVVNK